MPWCLVAAVAGGTSRRHVELRLRCQPHLPPHPTHAGAATHQAASVSVSVRRGVPHGVFVVCATTGDEYDQPAVHLLSLHELSVPTRCHRAASTRDIRHRDGLTPTYVDMTFSCQRDLYREITRSLRISRGAGSYLLWSTCHIPCWVLNSSPVAACLGLSAIFHI